MALHAPPTSEVAPPPVRPVEAGGGLALVALTVTPVFVPGTALGATNVARTSTGDDAPADLGLPHLEVGPRTADGVVLSRGHRSPAWLSGWDVPGTNGAAVAVRHEAGTVQEAVERLVHGDADLLTAAGPPPTLRAAIAAIAPRPVLLVTAGDR